MDSPKGIIQPSVKKLSISNLSEEEYSSTEHVSQLKSLIKNVEYTAVNTNNGDHKQLVKIKRAAEIKLCAACVTENKDKIVKEKCKTGKITQTGRKSSSSGTKTKNVVQTAESVIEFEKKHIRESQTKLKQKQKAGVLKDVFKIVKDEKINKTNAASPYFQVSNVTKPTNETILTNIEKRHNRLNGNNKMLENKYKNDKKVAKALMRLSNYFVHYNKENGSSDSSAVEGSCNCWNCLVSEYHTTSDESSDSTKCSCCTDSSDTSTSEETSTSSSEWSP